MKILLLLLIVITLFIGGCKSKYPGVPKQYIALLDSANVIAGDNAEQIFSALENSSIQQKEAAAFLIAYMPAKDLKTLSTEFVSDQINGALKVRNEFEWCKSLP
ncbi:MAG: transglutaminase domain-containing protein, partial [Draconibacterium sp.]|nr:transglutaminase domain-containing protein [Draconibacterium sp.]